MPFYRVTSRSLLIEADDAAKAAITAYRMFKDRTPTEFEVVGPDAEIKDVHLSAEQQDQAITPEFLKYSNT